MYLYTSPRGRLRRYTTGLGQEQEAAPAEGSVAVNPDRYYPFVATRKPVPHAHVVANMDGGMVCTCYQDAPREAVSFESLAYIMEIHPRGTSFVCKCNAKPGLRSCPPEVSQGARERDPFWQTHCRQWQQEQAIRNTALLETEDFRDRLAKRVVRVAGIPAWQTIGMGPAEFTTVLAERERRSGVIKALATIVFLGGGAYLGYRFVTRRQRRFKAEQERRAALGLPPLGEKPKKNFNGGTGTAVAAGAIALGTVATGVAAGIAAKAALDRQKNIVIYVAGNNPDGSPVEPEFRLAANSVANLINATMYPAQSVQDIIDIINQHEHINRLILFGHGAPESFMSPGGWGIHTTMRQRPNWISIPEFAALIAPKLMDGAVIGLAGCAAGGNPGMSRDWTLQAYASGGENSFAAHLRDALIQQPGIRRGIQIRAHKRRGHTTANPSAITFRVEPEELGRPGLSLIDELWGVGTSQSRENTRQFADEFRTDWQRRRSPADKWIGGAEWQSTMSLPPEPVWGDQEATV